MNLTRLLADASSLGIEYATLSGILMSGYSLAQFLSAPFWGKLSDQYGRKRILFISVLGNVLSYLLWAISQNYEVFLLSRLISGLTGGNISVAQSYIADVTSRENRAKAMGMFGAIFGIGFVIGPFIGGYLSTVDMTTINLNGSMIKFNQFSFIGIFCAFLSIGNLFMIKFNLPESRVLYTRNKGGNEGGHRQEQAIHPSLMGMIKNNQIGKRMALLIAVSFLFMISFVHIECTLAWDLLIRFNLDTQDTGAYFACMGLLLVFVQGGIYRIIQKKIAIPDLIKYGQIIVLIGLVGYAFSKDMIIFNLFVALITFGLGIVNPSLSAIVSLESSADRQGFHLGVMQSFSSLARAVVPIGSTLMYDYVSPLLPAFSASLFVFVAFILILYISKNNATSSC